MHSSYIVKSQYIYAQPKQMSASACMEKVWILAVYFQGQKPKAKVSKDNYRINIMNIVEANIFIVWSN